MKGDAIRSLSIPPGEKAGWTQAANPTFITSTQASPQSTDRAPSRYVQSNRSSPKRSLDDCLESCTNLQADLRPTKALIRQVFSGRSLSPTKFTDSNFQSGKWRGKATYSEKRNTILKSLDHKRFTQNAKEINIVSTFIGYPGMRRGSVMRPPQLQHKITYGDLQSKRVRTLLSLNKRDFGRLFDLSQVKLLHKQPFHPPIHRFPDEDDNAMLKREIARIQHDSLYDASKKDPPTIPRFFRLRSPPPEMEVDLDTVGTLSRFIFKEGGKYNSAWFSESRRYRQKKLQDVYEIAIEQRKKTNRP